MNLHHFHVRQAGGKIENRHVQAETFEEAVRLTEKRFPGVSILHALDNNMKLRINRLGKRGIEIAENMRG